MDQEAHELFQAQAFIYKHMFNYMDSMSLKCAVELGIPDAIHNHQKPIPLSDLASSLQISPSKLPHLHQLMRLLVHAGFFATVGEEEDDLAYALTPPSKLLLKDHPASLSPTVLPLLQPALLRPWERLGDWFGGGETEPTAFAAAHGMSFWEYGDRNPDFLRHFLETAMASDSRILCAAIPEYRAIFEGVSSLVDVGGGTGSVARAISEAFPDVKCTVLDLPQVVVDLPKTRNLDFVGGDMFRSVPSADAVLLKSVLHNWSNEDCIKILKRCREAIPGRDGGGKVIVIDFVVDEGKEDGPELTKTKLFLDMMMMVLVAGRERTEKEWEKVFVEAGFSHYRITHTPGIMSFIEVYP